MSQSAFRRLLPRADMLAAVAVVLVITMLVVPLPAPLLSLLITINIAVALTIVAATMYLGKALDFASFPSLLLLTTMFRLAINVSVTRLILTTGDAGSVVKAFGEFVVGGNVIVGLVIFLILVVIQFVVVTNGAGRVAEVGARFTLDAMPGKQMAIDADLNAGLITDDQARSRRSEIARRPTSTARWTAPRSSSKATRWRPSSSSRSTSSAGSSSACCSAACIRRSDPHVFAAHGRRRPGGTDAGAADLGRDRHHRHARRLGQGPRQRHRRPGPRPAQGAAGGGRRDRDVRSIPGLPKLPFILIAGIFAAIGWAVKDGMPGQRTRSRRRSRREDGAPCAGPEPIGEVTVDPSSSRSASGSYHWSRAAAAARCCGASSMIRRQIAGDLGLVIPPVRIHDELGMESHEYVLKVRGAEVTRGRIMPGHLLAMDPGGVSGTLSGIPTREPAFGLDAVWVHESARAEAEARGYTVVDPESVIVTHMTETIRSHAAELLTRQDVRALLDRLKETNAAVVEEVVPDTLSVGEIERVLQSLLSEGVPIRDLGTIVEAIGDKARTTRDTILLSEYARQALGRAITAPHLDDQLRCKQSPSTPPSSRRSPRRSHRPRTGSTSRWTCRGPRRSSPPCAPRWSMRPPAALSPCCCARHGSAATSGA